MITPKTLLTGLEGAIGSAYHSGQNRLYFVEFSGKISRYNLSPSSATTLASSNNSSIDGTHRFDFETGTMSPNSGVTGWDVFWQQQTAVVRNLRPASGSELSYLGLVNYNSLSAAELVSLSYSSDPIVGNDDSTNKLVNGAVFAVKTSNGNYAKVQVVNYGYNLEIRWRTYKIPNPYKVIGTGYTQPEDIALSADGQHAYVTERSGNLLKVDLSNANRTNATVVSSGMTAPHQISLDESRGIAHTVEFAASGRLLRIDLTSGTQTTLATGLDHAIGLAVTDDLQFAYISEQPSSGGRLRQIALSSGVISEYVNGLDNPFFLTWTDAGESGLLITERDPSNKVTKIDFTTGTISLSRLATVPGRPSSVAVINPFKLIACTDGTLVELDNSTTVYSPTGPLFLGIGHVPFDRISADGYADTTVDPAYFFQVKDAPFGGTLPLMLNHTKAFQDGAKYYKVEVDGVTQTQTWSDYRWSTSTNRFKLYSQNAISSGFYRVRRPNELWYNHWLGYRLNTTGLSNGLHNITIKFFGFLNNASQITSVTIPVKIDNTRPIVSIDEIIHQHSVNGPTVVNTCGIVTEPSDEFSFRITANDGEGHLKNWSIRALWGNNKSKHVDNDSYTPTPTKVWNGLVGQVVPSTPWAATVPGDITSKRCAHTFYLTAWDRVINGYTHIHRSTYHKSITLLLP